MAGITRFQDVLDASVGRTPTPVGVSGFSVAGTTGCIINLSQISGERRNGRSRQCDTPSATKMLRATEILARNTAGVHGHLAGRGLYNLQGSVSDPRQGMLHDQTISKRCTEGPNERFQ